MSTGLDDDRLDVLHFRPGRWRFLAGAGGSVVSGRDQLDGNKSSIDFVHRDRVDDHRLVLLRPKLQNFFAVIGSEWTRAI